jgi:hypothetical protein
MFGYGVGGVIPLRVENFSWTYHKWSKLDSVFPTRYFIPCRYMTDMFGKHPIKFLYVGSF